jgi:hypothetical protein
MQIVRRYRVKVHSVLVENGEPFGDTFTLDGLDTDRIPEAVAEGIDAVRSAGGRVHSVIVEPYAEFMP